MWAPFPPSKVRHIHVGFEVMKLAEAVAATGLEFRGDAICMGNTAGATWQDHYSGGKFYCRMAQAAVDKATQWRHAQHEAWKHEDEQ
jgi:hypothetical protein